MTGELDIATTPRFKRTLHDAQLQTGVVVLDLRELAFMDSAVFHAIVDASTHARRMGRRLVILRGPPNVDRAFALSGTSAELEIGDLDPVERPIQVLLQLAADDAAP